MREVQADLAQALSAVEGAGDYEAKLLLDHGVASLDELAEAEIGAADGDSGNLGGRRAGVKAARASSRSRRQARARRSGRGGSRAVGAALRARERVEFPGKALARMATKGMRAYNLATELGLGREELIKKAAEIGIEIRNPMASLDEETVDTIRRRLSATPAGRHGAEAHRRHRHPPPQAQDGRRAGRRREQASATRPRPQRVEVAAAALVRASRAPRSARRSPRRPRPAPKLRRTRTVSPGRRRCAWSRPRSTHAAQQARGDAAARGPASTPLPPPRAGPEPRPPPFADERGPHGAAPAPPARRADLTLREQETIAAHDARRKRAGAARAAPLIVEQQSRAQSQRGQSATAAQARAAEPEQGQRTVRIAGAHRVADCPPDRREGARPAAARAGARRGAPSEDFSRRHRGAGRRGARLRGAARRVRDRAQDRRVARAVADARPRAAPAGRHDHGPRRPRQDVAARQDPQGQRRGGRGRRHHAAHRRVPGAHVGDGDRSRSSTRPGHEAFTRCARAARRSPTSSCWWSRPTTASCRRPIEAINHAQARPSVPIVVAMNKIDKADANPQRVRQALLEHGLVAEDWGGDTICVDVSAHQGHGHRQAARDARAAGRGARAARATRTGRARGVVHRGRARPGPRPVATVLVQRGHAATRRRVRGRQRVRPRARDAWTPRASTVEGGRPVDAGARSSGSRGVPLAGDELSWSKNEREAQARSPSTACAEEQQRRVAGERARPRSPLEELFARMAGGRPKELLVI